MQIYKNEIELLNEFKNMLIEKRLKINKIKIISKAKKQSKEKNTNKSKQEENNFKSEKLEKEIAAEIITSIDSRLQIFEEYKLQSFKYTPESPIYIPQSPST
ncbi:22109_t:CDS:1, partial [Cetraspora pellucida]